MEKIERQLNLIALLLATGRPLTADEIRTKMADAYEEATEGAFHRMFERDKADIRDFGYVIEQVDPPLGGDPGYRIDREQVLAADPGLTPAEAAALSLAAQAWGGSDGTLGVLKLSLAADASVQAPAGWIARVDVDRTVTKLFEAISRRKVVRFGYRTGGEGDEREREVEPWGLYHRGVWYLSGYDRGAGAPRHFRLTRLTGSVSMAPGPKPDFDPPPGPDLSVRRGPWEGEPDAEAVVAFSPDTAWQVERRTGATRIEARDGSAAADDPARRGAAAGETAATAAGPIAGASDDEWARLRFTFSDAERFASWIAGFGARAEVVEPREVRDAVIERLRAAAGESQAAAGAP